MKIACSIGCGSSIMAGGLKSHEEKCTGQNGGSENEELDFKENDQENKMTMVQSVPQLVTNNNFNVLLNMAMNETTSTFKSTDQQQYSKTVCNFESHVINMNSFTWHREKHNLFDTEAKEDKLSKLCETVAREVNIIRKDKNVSIVTYNAS
jgi:hypothetical protein